MSAPRIYRFTLRPHTVEANIKKRDTLGFNLTAAKCISSRIEIVALLSCHCCFIPVTGQGKLILLRFYRDKPGTCLNNKKDGFFSTKTIYQIIYLIKTANSTLFINAGGTVTWGEVKSKFSGPAKLLGINYFSPHIGFIFTLQRLF